MNWSRDLLDSEKVEQEATEQTEGNGVGAPEPNRHWLLI